MSVGWSSSSHAPLNIVHSVHYISGRNNANMSWIFFKNPSWNILEICSVKSVDTLIMNWRKSEVIFVHPNLTLTFLVHAKSTGEFLAIAQSEV